MKRPQAFFSQAVAVSSVCKNNKEEKVSYLNVLDGQARTGVPRPAAPTGAPGRAAADQRRGAVHPGWFSGSGARERRDRGVSPGAEHEARLPVRHKPHCEALTGVADPITTWSSELSASTQEGG
jgi:hypothetical protein